MTPRIDRRSFLALGVGAVAWACSRGDDGGPDSSPAPGDDAISVVSTARQGLAIGDTRQGFAVFRGQRPINVHNLRVRLAPPDGEPFDVQAEHVEAKRGAGGESSEGTEVADIYVVRHDFDRAGVWNASLRFDEGRGTEVFQILDDAPSPIVGDEAIASKSPTTSDHRGVEPICTRTPMCSMHEFTLAEALGRNRPSVFVFGTPRYCESRTCGPVVDFVEQAKEKFSEEVTFVHIDQWKNDKSVGTVPGGLAPTFADWKFDTEPWIYFIGADGKVRDRWLGAVGPDELRKAVNALVST